MEEPEAGTCPENSGPNPYEPLNVIDVSNIRLPNWVLLLMLFALLPILPFYAMQMCARWLDQGIEWLFDGRWISRVLIYPSSRIENWYYEREIDRRGMRRGKMVGKILTEKSDGQREVS